MDLISLIYIVNENIKIIFLINIFVFNVIVILGFCLVFELNGGFYLVLVDDFGGQGLLISVCYYIDGRCIVDISIWGIVYFYVVYGVGFG